MIDRLLKKQIHSSQILFFALSSSLGLGILLVALQLFIDTQSLFGTKQDLLGSQNLIIYKDLGRDNAFSSKEISEIEQQDFVVQTGEFTHGTYRVVASVSLPNYNGLSTEMFLESVPDQFLDIKSEAWSWSPQNKEVPIIIPKNYINLYNFGYAASTGLPQIDENIIREIPIELTLIGSQKTQVYSAYILDASEKINSILVPESFLKETNKALNPGESKKVSRVILELQNSSDPRVLEYLATKNYNYLENDVQNSKLSYVLKLILSSVLGIGALITFLSLYLVITNINLLILKNKQTICQLHFLGVSKADIAKTYQHIAYKILAVSVALALAISMMCKYFFMPYLEVLQIDSELTSIVYICLAGLLLFFALAWYYKQHTSKKIGQMIRPNTSLLTTEI